MSRRLSLLFLLATALSLTAATLANARDDGKGAARAAAIATELLSPSASTKTVTEIKRCPLPSRFRPAFEQASKKTGIPLSLLVAVAQEESNFKPNAVSHAGALGLLQVLPATARELEINLDSTEANVLAGARYLRRMLDRFDGAGLDSMELALEAYNAGPTAVEKAGGAPSPQTQTYADEVIRRWQRLAGCS
jgi:soluble lytic murein transglycosylase-like protein